MTLKTVPLSELLQSDTVTLASLIGDTVVINITDDGETATVIGDVEIITILDEGVAIKIVGSNDPVTVSTEEYDNVTVTAWNLN